MTAESDAYRKLQEHLDKMPIGYPATQSGVEINLLKVVFTPEEANIATHLDYKHKSIDQIFESVKAEVGSKETLSEILDAIVGKGGITRRVRDNQKQYAVLPLVLWGMFEHQLKRLSPEFLMNYGQYIQNEFGYELASSKLPKMRVIPVEESVKVEHQVSTYDELRSLIEQAGDHIAIQDCICRTVSDNMGKHCQATERREVCMSYGDLADLYVEEGWGRKISQEEALEISRKNEEEGLVMMPGNAKEMQFMCACCGDCCGMLSMLKYVPRPSDAVASNYYAEVNIELCKGNGTCVKRCPTEAVKLEENVSVIEPAKCIGCGVCVPTCPNNAILMVKKDQEIIPPETEEDLYDQILEGKKQRS
jgi:NAD-dependent dihydropyrimidine dehydrogenase PreA subunit